MAVIPAIDTLLGDNRYDFSSLEASFNGVIFTGITEISYTQSLTPGIQRGASARKLGRTRGEYDATGSFTMYKEDYSQLIAALAAAGIGSLRGYGELPFVITAVYEEGGRIKVDKLKGARITNDEDSHSQGSDILVVSAEIDLIEIERDGAKMVGESNIAGALIGAAGALLPI